MASETALRPHDVMRLVGQDRREELLASESIWLCLTCETCVARCPNECDPARTIDAVPRDGVGRPPGSVPRALSSPSTVVPLLDQVRLTGRLFEFGLMAEYKLRSAALFADVTAARGMVARGKLGFVPHQIKGVKEVRRIFEACESPNQEKP